MPKALLYAPAEYWELTPEQLKDIIGEGRCGPGKLGGKIVPDRIWGLNIKPACSIHDFMWAVGATDEDRREADRAFLNNILRLIDAAAGPWLLVALRRHAAAKYYRAVADFGGPAFWAGKNPAPTMALVEA